MISVSYSHRILIDPEFVKWVAIDSEKKSMIITKMLRINQNSKEHKKENILILKKDFDKLCEDNIIKDKDMIRGGMSPLDTNGHLLKNIVNGASIDDYLIRLISGVLIAREKPFQSVLLTTKENKKEYEKHNDFLEKIPNFSIKDEEESLVILGDLYRNYLYERENNRF